MQYLLIPICMRKKYDQIIEYFVGRKSNLGNIFQTRNMDGANVLRSSRILYRLDTDLHPALRYVLVIT